MNPEMILATLASEIDYLKKEEWFITATKELDVLTVLSAIRQVTSASLAGELHLLAKSNYKYFDNGGHTRMSFQVLMGNQDVGDYVFENIWCRISNRALNGLPLTVIEDTPDMWVPITENSVCGVTTHKRAKNIVMKTGAGETYVIDGTYRHYLSGLGIEWVKQRPTLIPITLPCEVNIEIKNAYFTIEGDRLAEIAARTYLENIFIERVCKYCHTNLLFPFDQDDNGVELTTADLAAGVERFFSDLCVSVDNFKWKLKSRRELLEVMNCYLLSDHFSACKGELLTALTIYQEVESCDFILKVKGINNKNRIRGICVNDEDLKATHAIGNFRKDPNDEWKDSNIIIRTIKVLNA